MWDTVKDILTYHAAEPMLFSSGLFLWLFAGFFCIYLLLRERTTARLLFVLLFSYYLSTLVCCAILNTPIFLER